VQRLENISMSKPSVIFAATEHVDAYEELCAEFVHEILALPWAMISDESRLSDFRSLGQSQRGDSTGVDDAAAEAYWDEKIVRRVCDRYGVESFSVDIKMVDLFARIDRMLPRQ
jgi:hypothetical protein